MKRVWMAMLLFVVVGAPAVAAPRTTDPDWPCQQAKLRVLSMASYWSGPAVDPVALNWQQDAAVASLVGEITQRRMPLAQASARISEFIRAAAPDGRHAALMLFAGVFDVLNRERVAVLDGLDRFGERQKVLAERLRRQGEELRIVQDAVPLDDAKVAELSRQLAWDSALFEQRRQSLRYACDVPATIEQRLYGLAKAIQQDFD